MRELIDNVFKVREMIFVSCSPKIDVQILIEKPRGCGMRIRPNSQYAFIPSTSAAQKQEKDYDPARSLRCQRCGEVEIAERKSTKKGYGQPFITKLSKIIVPGERPKINQNVKTVSEASLKPQKPTNNRRVKKSLRSTTVTLAYTFFYQSNSSRT
jgi:hypothetical protein